MPRITRSRKYVHQTIRDPVYGAVLPFQTGVTREDAFIGRERARSYYFIIPIRPKYRRASLKPARYQHNNGRAGRGRLSIITWTCARLTPTKDDF